MEEAKEAIKKIAKKILKHSKRVLIFTILPFILIIILLSAALYYITIDDGTYKEDDWTSTPYGAAQYMDGVSINEDGEFETETTTQDLWDKMLEEHSRVDEYLDSPEELARMMKAELITQYPDTRPNPDEPIDWDELIENPDKIQGIIKFKRADINGNKWNLTYANPETFQSYVDAYNNNGDETAKKNALSHFTLKHSDSSASSNVPNGSAGGNVNGTDGDGYTEEYKSSAGITYKNYKQGQGSYAQNPYWDGTIRTSGCGPTSLAILASGLTNLNYSPGTIAAEMNSTYGETSHATLQAEMNSLGMSAQVIKNPSASTIQDNLRNGKVMLVSVNRNTIFTTRSHIMALVDIDSSGRVYVCNPGDSTGRNGWYDISEIMKGCNYIIVTDANGGTPTGGTTVGGGTVGNTVVVATWTQVDTEVTTDDPNVQGKDETTYSMTTTNINYEAMVKQYTMPFDMLWALLVVGEDKNFIFELTDLIYGSDIQITVHDNLTVNTQVDEWSYTEQIKAVVDATITASCNGQAATDTITNDVHDPHEENPYKTTKTVVTQTNTVQTELTKADVWIVYYENEFTYNAPVETTTSSTVEKGSQEYPNTPNSEGDSYSCEHINAKKTEVTEKVRQAAAAADAAEKEAKDNTSSTAPDSAVVSQGMQSPTKESTIPDYAAASGVTYQVTCEEEIKVKYYNRYVNMIDNVTNTINTQKYVKGVAAMKEKTDSNSTDPNFVTIFRDKKYKLNKSRINDASEWLFEIIETNQSKVMLDLIKYLLYKATGTVYDSKTDFNFGIFYPTELTTVGAGDYIVDTIQSSSDIVITELNTLKQAFSGYSNDRVLQQYAETFLKFQNQYHVNAVFAAAVSITESSAGTNISIGGNNMFSISNGGQGNWNSYPTMENSIEAFFKLIGEKYFGRGQYTVSTIGGGNPPGTYCYCVPPEGWIETTTKYMTQMFNAAGIDASSSVGAGSSEVGAIGTQIVAAAESKKGCSYVWGASGPNTFDCSGLTMWCYAQAGIQIPHNSEQQKNSATKVVSVSEARVGDILWRNGHVAIYIGNNQYIHSPQTGDKVKIASGVSSFTYALQFY